MQSGAETVSVRAMAERDLDAVLQIARTLPSAPQWPRAAYLAALDPAAVPQRTALVAERDGRIAGFAVASRIGEEAEIESISVAVEAQRQGLGRTLLDALLRALAEAGTSQALLEVRASNDGALRLYRRAGFRESGLRPRYYRDPEEDAVLLRWGRH